MNLIRDRDKGHHKSSPSKSKEKDRHSSSKSKHNSSSGHKSSSSDKNHRLNHKSSIKTVFKLILILKLIFNSNNSFSARLKAAATDINLTEENTSRHHNTTIKANHLRTLTSINRLTVTNTNHHLTATKSGRGILIAKKVPKRKAKKVKKLAH